MRPGLAAALTVLLLSACGTSTPPPAQPDEPETGFRSGECNFVTDEDVVRAGGAGRFTRVLANDIGCFWQEDVQFGSAGDGMGIATWWYRGSDLESELDLERKWGRTIKEVTVDGKPGVEAYDDSACSVYVVEGDDIIAWSIQTFNSASFPDLCTIVRPLAQLTQDRMG